MVRHQLHSWKKQRLLCSNGICDLLPAGAFAKVARICTRTQKLNETSGIGCLTGREHCMCSYT
jgi:hypothetical protein